jgi:hypothetical protein
MGAYALEISGVAFGQSCERFEAMVCWLDSPQAQELTHAELETRLQAEGRELLRQLTQDHLDLRAQRETRLEQVVGADGSTALTPRPVAPARWPRCSGRSPCDASPTASPGTPACTPQTGC